MNLEFNQMSLCEAGRGELRMRKIVACVIIILAITSSGCRPAASPVDRPATSTATLWSEAQESTAIPAPKPTDSPSETVEAVGFPHIGIVLGEKAKEADANIMAQCAEVSEYRGIDQAVIEPQILTISQDGKTTSETINICKLGDQGFFVLSRESVDGKGERMINEPIKIRVKEDGKTMESFYINSKGKEVPLISYEATYNVTKFTNLAGLVTPFDDIDFQKETAGLLGVLSEVLKSGTVPIYAETAKSIELPEIQVESMSQLKDWSYAEFVDPKAAYQVLVTGLFANAEANRKYNLDEFGTERPSYEVIMNLLKNSVGGSENKNYWVPTVSKNGTALKIASGDYQSPMVIRFEEKPAILGDGFYLDTIYSGTTMGSMMTSGFKDSFSGLLQKNYEGGVIPVMTYGKPSFPKYYFGWVDINNRLMYVAGGASGVIDSASGFESSDRSRNLYNLDIFFTNFNVGLRYEGRKDERIICVASASEGGCNVGKDTFNKPIPEVYQ
jgi:hypothetical protein